MNRFKVLNLTSNPLTPEQLANNGIEVEESIRKALTHYMHISSIENIVTYLEEAATLYECNSVYIDVPVYRKIEIYKELKARTDVVGVISLTNNGVHTRWVNATDCISLDIPSATSAAKVGKAHKHKIYSVLNLSKYPLNEEQLADNGYQFDDQSRTMFSKLIAESNLSDLPELLTTLALDNNCNAVYLGLHILKVIPIAQLMQNTPITIVSSLHIDDRHSLWLPILKNN